MKERFRTGTGMLLGKFMPPHLGHVYLAEFARQYVERLAIVVCSLEREPIPGVLRHGWMRALFPSSEVIHVTDELPQEPSEHPDFWRLWKDALERVLPFAPDRVFASEPYGWQLAEVLGARFVPVDQARGVVPISGTAVRADPMASWRFIPVPVRPYFARRVCVFGPESTGKSTLAQRLAREFETVCVPEYARTHLEARGGRVTPEDLLPIARGQIASEDALARQANRVLVCDTDPLTTVLWAQALFGRCPDEIERESRRRRYDLYLLLDVDVPFVPDPVRYLPDERESFFARCRRALDDRRLPYVVLRGGWDERFETARKAVTELVKMKRVEDQQSAVMAR